MPLPANLRNSVCDKSAKRLFAIVSPPVGIIVITEGPGNITAYVGDSVTLPCLYTGTLDQPKWRVGTVVFLSSDPPAGYEYTNEGLRILSVWPLLNNTQFVCFFTEFIGEEGFKNTESHPGFITVKIRCKTIKRPLTLHTQIIVISLSAAVYIKTDTQHLFTLSYIPHISFNSQQVYPQQNIYPQLTEYHQPSLVCI